MSEWGPAQTARHCPRQIVLQNIMLALYGTTYWPLTNACLAIATAGTGGGLLVCGASELSMMR